MTRRRRTTPPSSASSVGFSLRIAEERPWTVAAPSFEASLVQPDDTIHLPRDALVVRSDQRRAPFAAHEVQELGEDDVGGVLVEVAGGLVGEDQGRLVGERARHADALLLAAGELRRPMVESLRQPELAEQLLRPPLRRPAIQAAYPPRQDPILPGVEFGQQVVKLIYE